MEAKKQYLPHEAPPIMRPNQSDGIEVDEEINLFKEAKVLVQHGQYALGLRILRMHLAQHSNDSFAFKLALTLSLRLHDEMNFCHVMMHYGQEQSEFICLPVLVKGIVAFPENLTLKTYMSKLSSN